MVIPTPIENESLQVFLKPQLPANFMDIAYILYSVTYEKKMVLIWVWSQMDYTVYFCASLV